MDPILNSKLNAAFTNFNTRFEAGKRTAPTWWNSIAMEVPSGTESETYEWLQEFPIYQKWIGPRKVRPVASSAYQLRNELWESTIGMSIDKFNDDQFSFYAPMMELMGQGSMKFVDQQVKATLVANPVGFDGLAFFHDAHPIDVYGGVSGTYDNNFTLALTSANFNEVFAKMVAFKAPNGEVMGWTPDTLWYPPALREAALTVLAAGIVVSGGAGVTNINQGAVRGIMVPELAGADTTWYLGVGNAAIKPIIYQRREQTGFRRNDQKMFSENKVEFGDKVRAAFGVSFPFLLSRSVG